MVRVKLLLAAALAGAVAVSGVWWHGNSHGKRTSNQRALTAIMAATEKARTTEREQQEGINRALQYQIEEMAGVNAGLAADLDRLRQRPARPSVPRDPGVDCAAATGAELSGPDAGFLVREAARADELRAGLRACYQYADTLIRHRKLDATQPGGE
jgi:uncharacterized membrane protein